MYNTRNEQLLFICMTFFKEKNASNLSNSDKGGFRPREIYFGIYFTQEILR